VAVVVPALLPVNGGFTKGSYDFVALLYRNLFLGAI
jgi:hypothetical protein